MKNYLILLSVLFFSFNLVAQKGFTTKTVTIFKNNSGFFTKKGIINPQKKHHLFDLETMPKATFGTFWLSGQNLMHLTSYQKEMILVKETKLEHIPSRNHDFLKINKGKKVKLFLRGDKIFQGIIKEVSTSLAFLQLENGELLSLPTQEIIYVILLEKSNEFKTTNRSDTTKTTKQIVDLQFKDNRQQNLELVYFQNGIGWTPSYKIELQPKSKAKITMQAALSNQAEDLENVNINFVVGYPNIKYANTLDVLFNDTNIAKLINQNGQNNYVQLLDRGRRGGANVYSSSVFTPSEASDNTSTNSTNIQSVSEEDFYFYSLNNISLPKGGRGYFSIFETTVPYNDLYEVDLIKNHNNYYAYQPVDYNDEFRNKVWHLLELENKSEHAWTSGAAMVVKKDKDVVRPISQDDLNYVPMQGTGKLKLTISPDVSVKDYEKEKERTTRKLEKDGQYYEIVTVAGEIKIQNFKSENIQLNIKKTIVGNLLNSNFDWLKSARVNIQIPLNKINEVCWEIKLKAGEKKVIEYEYDVYVRR
ncbi:MAG: DUF4139 domain-containing protein [Saprospiraceae bacterium]